MSTDGSMDALIVTHWMQLVGKAKEYGFVRRSRKPDDGEVIELLIQILDEVIPMGDDRHKYKNDPEVIRHWSYLEGVADAYDVTPTALLDDVDWEEAEKRIAADV